MQALSICPLKGDFEFQLVSPSSGCIIKKGRRTRKGVEISDSVVTHRRPSFLFASSYFVRLNGIRANCCSPEFYLGYGFSSRNLRSTTDRGLPLGWALEGRAIGDTVSEDGLEQIDTFLKETQEKIIDDIDDGALHVDGSGISEDVEVKTRDNSDFQKEKGRVDVRQLAQTLQLVESVEDVESVLKDNDELPLQVFSSIIRVFGRENRLEPAMVIVEWLKMKRKPNLFIYNSLLGAVKQTGQLDKVDIVMNDMEQAGISPNVVTYNTLMGVYLDQGRAVEALNLFDDIQHKGLSPSPASYSTALLAYRRKEDGNGALKIFLLLKEKFINGELDEKDGENWDSEFPKFKNFTTRICYQVMRRWLVKDGNFTTDVLKLIIEMDKADLSPNREEYERLIWACTREEHYVVAKELYTRIRERYSDISLSVCNHIIWLMGKAKKWWAALEIYEDLLDKGPKPNNLSQEIIISHFNVLLSAARKRGIWRWGIRLLNKMESKGLTPGSKEWNSVLIACSKASETKAAIEVFMKMVEKGEKPTVVSYGALLSALEKGKLYDEAIRVWEHMLKVGIKPNIYAYTIMASVYVGLGKFTMVDYIIKDMGSTGNDPTVVTFNAIISGCARNGLGGVAYEWFERMKSMSIEPNDITYETLIEALALDGKPRLAYDMYLRAVNEGMNPSAQVYDAVIQSSQNLGATIDVTALGPRPPEKKKKVVNRRSSVDSSSLDDASRRIEISEIQEFFVQ